MLDVTEEAGSAKASQPAAPRRERRELSSAQRGVVVGGALIGCSVILIAWARTRPGYDPFGWLVWGQQTLNLSLDLAGAPSWKPLPYLFTVPYALAGSFALRLWMVTAVAVALAGVLFAGRIAYRLVARGAPDAGAASATRRLGARLAAIVAGAALLGIEGYIHYILSAQSDPMIVTFCLAGIDSFLCGRYRWAFVLGVLGSLGRPEVWPLLGLLAVWAWFTVPSMRWMVCAGGALIAFLWFGIPAITNGRPNVAGQLALGSPRAPHSNKVTGTVERFLGLHFLPVWIAAAATVVAAIIRRDRAVVLLAVGAVIWVAVEIAFALHGFPALSRYMFEAGAFVAIIAAVGVGRLASDLPRLRVGARRWAALPVAAVLLASLIPGAVDRLRAERLDLRHERGRARQISLLGPALDALGGYRRVRHCGRPATNVEYGSIVAWMTHLNVGHVGYRPDREKHRGDPIVLLLPIPGGGWRVRPWHTRARQRHLCARLKARYVLTPSHRSGQLIRG